jgi:hypothetical protein
MPKRFAFQVVGKHPKALNTTRDPTMAGEGTGLGPAERVRRANSGWRESELANRPIL